MWRISNKLRDLIGTDEDKEKYAVFCNKGMHFDHIGNLNPFTQIKCLAIHFGAVVFGAMKYMDLGGASDGTICNEMCRIMRETLSGINSQLIWCADEDDKQFAEEQYKKYLKQIAKEAGL